MLVIALWLLLVLAVPAAHADARLRDEEGSARVPAAHADTRLRTEEGSAHVPTHARKTQPPGGPLGVPAAYAGTWQRPVDGPLLRGFALGRDPYAGGWHRGIDLASARGSPVRSACAGRVTFAGRVPRGGRTVSVRCGAVVATFQQLGTLAVRAGARVMRGARIGTVGASSDPRQRRPHVHLGARVVASGRYLDPLSLLRERPAPLPLAPPARRTRPRGVPLQPAPRLAPRPVPLGPPPRMAPRAVPLGPVPRLLPRAAPLGPAPATPRLSPVPAPPAARVRRPAPRMPLQPVHAAPRAAPPGPGSAGPGPGVPWLVWLGLACFGLGLPVGGFVRRRRRRHATVRVARAA